MLPKFGLLSLLRGTTFASATRSSPILATFTILGEKTCVQPTERLRALIGFSVPPNGKLSVWTTLEFNKVNRPYTWSLSDLFQSSRADHFLSLSWSPAVPSQLKPA